MNSQFDTSIQLLDALNQIANPLVGWNSTLGRDLVGYLGVRLADIARKESMPREDAVCAAFEVFLNPGFESADDAWGYTRHLVARRLGKENEAQRKLNSVENIRHVGIAGNDYFVRSSSDGLDDLIQDLPTEAPSTSFRLPQLVFAVRFLTDAGFDADDAELAVDTLIDQAAASSSLHGAADTLARLGDRLSPTVGMSAAQWAAFVAMLFGSSKALRATNGAQGLLASILVGDGQTVIQTKFSNAASARFLAATASGLAA
jgi:hypothetical protein